MTRGKEKRKLGRLLKGFRDSMSALPDAMVVVDKKSKIEWWNKAAARLLGLERRRGRVRRLDEVFKDRKVGRKLARRSSKGEPREIPSPVDSSVLLEVRVVPYGKGKRLLQARDITRIRRLERMRRDFVENASHELRTPLTVVHGYLETLVHEEQAGSGRWSNILRRMYQQTKRINDIIGDMLELARLEEARGGKAEQRVDMSALITEVHQEWDPLNAGRKHRIELDLQPGCSIYAGVDDVRCVFSNLLSNARHYTPAGGKISIRWWLDDGGGHLSVEDTGIGILAEHIPRLTERFYRVDKGRSRETGGTGLGLAIVKHVLKRYGARLTILSEPGVGSTFTCHFPASMVFRAAA